MFIYLGKRDKKGVRLLATINSDVSTGPLRVSNIKDLNLNASLEEKLAAAIHEERMLWECWIESASSFNELKNNLRKRGYTNLPIHGMPDVKSTVKAKDKKSMIKRGSIFS